MPINWQQLARPSKFPELSFNDFAPRLPGATDCSCTLPVAARAGLFSRSLLSINEKRVSLTRGRRLPPLGGTRERGEERAGFLAFLFFVPPANDPRARFNFLGHSLSLCRTFLAPFHLLNRSPRASNAYNKPGARGIHPCGASRTGSTRP